MRDHVHMVVGRPRYEVEKLVRLLKGAATTQLTREGIHPFVDAPDRDGSFRSPWARGEWKVYLNSTAEILRAIKYVEDNPVREGKKKQAWKFVQGFQG